MIFDEIHGFLHNECKKNHPELENWKLPPKKTRFFDTLADRLHSGIELKAASNRISFPIIPENELTAVGAARVVLHLHHLVQADVFEAARLLIEEHSDLMIQNLFGDHATVDGLERNKEKVIAAVAKIAEDPLCDLAEDEKAANIVVLMLICLVYGYTGRGDLHTSMAIVNLRVRVFDDLILKFIRYSYPHFRGLSATKFLANEYDNWRDLLKTVDYAISLEAFQVFFNGSGIKESISQTTDSAQIVTLYKDFAKRTVFGNGADATPEQTDFPALTLHGYLFLSRLQKLHDKSIFACFHPAKNIIAAALLPLFSDSGQHNYARLMAHQLGSLMTRSDRKLDYESSHTSFSHTAGAPGQGMDAHNEHAVEDAKKGDHVTAKRLKARTRQSGVRSRFLAWGRSFVGWKKKEHGKKGIARLPSALVIHEDLINGMGKRPDTHPRQSPVPFLQALANQRMCLVPLSFIEKSAWH